MYGLRFILFLLELSNKYYSLTMNLCNFCKNCDFRKQHVATSLVTMAEPVRIQMMVLSVSVSVGCHQEKDVKISSTSQYKIKTTTNTSPYLVR